MREYHQLPTKTQVEFVPPTMVVTTWVSYTDIALDKGWEIGFIGTRRSGVVVFCRHGSFDDVAMEADSIADAIRKLNMHFETMYHVHDDRY